MPGSLQHQAAALYSAEYVASLLGLALCLGPNTYSGAYCLSAAQLHYIIASPAGFLTYIGQPKNEVLLTLRAMLALRLH